MYTINIKKKKFIIIVLNLKFLIWSGGQQVAAQKFYLQKKVKRLNYNIPPESH